MVDKLKNTMSDVFKNNIPYNNMATKNILQLSENRMFIYHLLKMLCMKEPIDMVNNCLLYLLLYVGIKSNKYKTTYECVYDSNKNSSYITYIKNIYKHDLYVLQPIEFEKLIQLYNSINKLDTTDIISDIFSCIFENKEFNFCTKILTQNFTNRHLINFIKTNLITNYNNLLCLSSQSGEFNTIVNKTSSIYNFSEEHHVLWTNIALELKNLPVNCIHDDFIHNNTIMKSYDLILCNFPSGIKNIIHANCCQKIKKLKLRGTKSEPIILQLIMTVLNNNGKACVIVPNTLLFNESSQHIETRQYLLNNFIVSKVISIEGDLYNKPNYSILIFDKTSITQQVDFGKLELIDNEVVYSKLRTVNISQIKQKNFILYLEKYIDIEIIANKNMEYKLEDIIKIIDDTNVNTIDTQLLNGNYLLIPKYISKNESIELMFNDFTLNKDHFTIICKNTELHHQKYVNYYFNKIIAPNIALTAIGKLKKISYNALLNLSIIIPSLKIQKTIISYFDLNYNLINQNNIQIESYKQLNIEYINLITNKYDYIELDTVCTINNKPTKNTDITIQKNSNIAGNVKLYSDIDNDNNNLFFIDVNSSYNKTFVYLFLKNNEYKLNKLANLTQTVILNKSNLEKFKIKNIPIDIQNTIVEQSKKYDAICDNLKEINNNILASDIIKNIYTLDDTN